MAVKLFFLLTLFPPLPFGLSRRPTKVPVVPQLKRAQMSHQVAAPAKREHWECPSRKGAHDGHTVRPYLGRLSRRKSPELKVAWEFAVSQERLGPQDILQKWISHTLLIDAYPRSFYLHSYILRRLHDFLLMLSLRLSWLLSVAKLMMLITRGSCVATMKKATVYMGCSW